MHHKAYHTQELLCRLMKGFSALTDGILIGILLNAVNTHDWIVNLNWHISAFNLKVLIEFFPAHLQQQY